MEEMGNCIWGPNACGCSVWKSWGQHMGRAGSCALFTQEPGAGAPLDEHDTYLPP